MGTTKKNYAYSSHIGEDFWPANESCHFSYATKLKTTCSFFTIFSSCIFISDAVFQMNFNFTINRFPIWKIIKFWLICTTGATKATEHFLAKSGVWKYWKWSGEPSKRTYRVPFLFIPNTLQRYLSHRKILISALEKIEFFFSSHYSLSFCFQKRFYEKIWLHKSF